MLTRYRSKRPGTPLSQMLLYSSIRLFVRILFAIFYRARVIGADRVPPSGALLMVCNHQSNLDPPLVGSTVTTRHIDFMAKLGLFTSSRFLSWLITALNSLPIKEEGADTAAIKETLSRLEAGRAVLVFPEGTRSLTGRMEPFKRGVAVLVKRAECPVMPIAVEGCFEGWPRGSSFPKLFGIRVAVKYGNPIPHEELMSGTGDEALRRLEREIDAMRLELRADLRRSTHGRFPPRGDADLPFTAAG